MSSTSDLVTQTPNYNCASGTIAYCKARSLHEAIQANVTRAYLELEHAGIVTKRHGSGTYVSEARNPMSQREKTKILAKRVDALLTEARHLDVELSEVFKLLRERDGVMDGEVAK